MAFAAASLYGNGKSGGILDLSTRTRVPEAVFEETADTKKILDNLTKASASANQQLQPLIAKALAFIGGNALKYARSILNGHPAPGMAVAAAHQATMELRHENRQSTNPLFEYGVLARNLVAKINPDGLLIYVNRGERKVPQDRPHQKPIAGGMNALAAMLEFGFKLNVTPRSKAYFEFQWHNAQRELEGKQPDLGYSSINNIYLARTAVVGWKRLASLPVGKHQVEARPFIAPSASKAMHEFFDKEFVGWGRLMENWLIHNKITIPGGEI